MADSELQDIGPDRSLLLVDDDEPFLKRLARAMEKVARQPYTYPEQLFEQFEPSKVAHAYQQFASKHI